MALLPACPILSLFRLVLKPTMMTGTFCISLHKMLHYKVMFAGVVTGLPYTIC